MLTWPQSIRLLNHRRINERERAEKCNENINTMSDKDLVALEQTLDKFIAHKLGKHASKLYLLNEVQRELNLREAE